MDKTKSEQLQKEFGEIKSGKVTYEQISTRVITDFLKNASPSERHQMVSEWNHDAGYGVFNIIVNDPETDKATALMMYWKSGGKSNKTYANREDMLKKASWDTERYDLIERLEEKYLSGFYKNQQFAYNPADDNGYDRTKDDWGEPKRSVPDEMLRKLDGKLIEPEEDWQEGIPPRIHEEINELRKRARNS